MGFTVVDGLFVAPIDAPYGEELRKACWRNDGRRYYTDELERVAAVIQYADPSLVATLMSADTSYAKSSALEPSGDIDIPLPEGKTLFGYQLADIEFILSKHSTLLAEDAGLGKSAIMIGVANYLNCKSVLIICPAVAKYNWLLKEWPKWTTLKHLTIGAAEGNYFPDTDVVLINYDILPRHKKKLQAKTWDYLIVDESHRIKNKDAKRTKMVLGGTMKVKQDAAEEMGLKPGRTKGTYKVPKIEAGKRVFASATPMNRPKDLWTMAEACDPEGLGANWMTFHRRYCAMKKTPFGWDINGADRLPELGARLRGSFMMRHDPQEVLDLPPLREELFLLPPVKIVIEEEEQFVHDNMDALLNLSAQSNAGLDEESSPEEFLKLIGEAIIDNVSLIGKPEFTPLFSKFALIRKATGIAKVKFVVDFVREISDDLERPIVVFGYHREVMEKLKEEFPDAAFVIGGMSSKSRDLEVDKFQTGQTNVFLGNIDAAGEAITLTRANLLVFAEPDWRGTAMVQARKRIHRITQDQPCSVYYLAAANSFDSYVADRGFAKMEHIKETLDL